MTKSTKTTDPESNHDRVVQIEVLQDVATILSAVVPEREWSDLRRYLQSAPHFAIGDELTPNEIDVAELLGQYLEFAMKIKAELRGQTRER